MAHRAGMLRVSCRLWYSTRQINHISPNARGKEEFPTLSIAPFHAELTRSRQIMSLFEGVPLMTWHVQTWLPCAGHIVVVAKNAKVHLE